MSGDKLVAFPGNATPDKVRESFRNLQTNIEVLLDGQALLAQLTRAKYEALLEQGFTRAEALELCKG